MLNEEKPSAGEGEVGAPGGSRPTGIKKPCASARDPFGCSRTETRRSGGGDQPGIRCCTECNICRRRKKYATYRCLIDQQPGEVDRRLADALQELERQDKKRIPDRCRNISILILYYPPCFQPLWGGAARKTPPVQRGSSYAKATADRWETPFSLLAAPTASPVPAAGYWILNGERMG